MNNPIEQDPLSLFTEAVDRKDYNLAYNYLIQILHECNSSGFHYQESRYFSDRCLAQENSDKIATAIVKLFTDSHFRLNWQRYSELVNHVKSIIAIFQNSQFDSSQACQQQLISQLSQIDDSKDKESLIYKILLMTDLASINKDILTWFTELDHRVVTPMILALLGLPVVVGEREHLNRESLLSFGPIINQQLIDFCFTGIFAVAWMHTSYALRADKHLFKGHLNQLMRRTLEANGLKQALIKPHKVKAKRPKLLVVAEVFSSNHAMARCYQNYIIQLKKNYKVCLLTSEDAVDDRSRELFDEVVNFSLSKSSINQIADLISKQKADILYYPSIGMATWTVMLVTYRFAPIQIAATGHPATSISSAIDYLIGPEFLFYNEELYSEKLLCIGNDLEATHVPPTNEKIPVAKIRKQPKTVSIAVNAIAFKLNAAFLSICQQIEKETSREIKWCFFSNQVGLQHYNLQKQLDKQLGSVTLVKSQDFNQYLEELNQCDMALSPFPFGGSNSNIDLLRLGIPLVFLTGEEAHSRTDEFYFQYFDLCEGLASQNIDDYLLQAKRLILDDEYRVRLSNKILSKNPDKLILDKNHFQKHDVSEAVSWVFTNHHEIIKDKIKKITCDYRLTDTSKSAASIKAKVN